MGSVEIGSRRMASQLLRGPRPGTAAEVVRHMGAVQAQDYRGGLLAIGLRMREATEAVVESALAERLIVRTWPMRGTLHIVASADARWMLQLLAPRAVARAAGRYRQLGLGAAELARCRGLVEKKLRGGVMPTRGEMYELFEKGGVSPEGQRGIHILGWLAQKCVICFGPRRGKQHTFTLLDEWIPPAPVLPREEALAWLALIYFRSHGPATVRDFAWWTGLTIAEAAEGLAAVTSRLGEPQPGLWAAPPGRGAPRATPAARTLLLPPFDELLVAYKDRSAAVDPAHVKELHALLSPTIASGGRIIGTWGRKEEKGRVHIACRFFAPRPGGFAPRPGGPPPRTSAEMREVEAAVRRYGDFVGMDAVLAPPG